MSTRLTDDQVTAFLNKKNNGPQVDLSALEVSLDEIDSFGSVDSIKEMFGDLNKYNKMLREKILFINSDLSAVIPFTRENLYLICAYTGNGKSTIAATISYPLWQQNKKVLVISNEEPKQDIIFRIGCLQLGLNFNDYKKGIMPKEQQQQVALLFPEITKWVKVLDVTYQGGLTTKLEGIKSALNAVRNADYSCVLIDYYQLIQYSVEDKHKKRYDVLNDLRIWFGQYIKDSNIPIVLFAQLHSMGKRNNTQLDSRVKECPTILEPSTVVIEAIPDFETSTTKFLIHKDRFGLIGQSVTCGFQNGRYVNMSDEFRASVHERTMKRKQDEAEKILKSLEEPKDDKHEKMPDL